MTKLTLSQIAEQINALPTKSAKSAIQIMRNLNLNAKDIELIIDKLAEMESKIQFDLYTEIAEDPESFVDDLHEMNNNELWLVYTLAYQQQKDMIIKYVEHEKILEINKKLEIGQDKISLLECSISDPEQFYLIWFNTNLKPSVIDVSIDEDNANKLYNIRNNNNNYKNIIDCALEHNLNSLRYCYQRDFFKSKDKRNIHAINFVKQYEITFAEKKINKKRNLVCNCSNRVSRAN